MKIKQQLKKYKDKIIDFIESKRKWKLKIYYLNQLVCTRNIEHFKETKEVLNKPYVCRVHKKHLFKTLNTQVILLPSRVLFLDETKQQLHVDCLIYEGVAVDEI